jgi:hypothetical protein
MPPISGERISMNRRLEHEIRLEDPGWRSDSIGLPFGILRSSGRIRDAVRQGAIYLACRYFGVSGCNPFTAYNGATASIGNIPRRRVALFLERRVVIADR